MTYMLLLNNISRFLEAIAEREGREETVKAVVIETYLLFISDYGLGIRDTEPSVIDMEADLRPDVKRNLKREREIIFDSDLTVDRHHEAVVEVMLYYIKDLIWYLIIYIAQGYSRSSVKSP